jgi:deoxyhypusine synthase
MGTDEFHWLLGKYVAARQRKLRIKDSSVLATAYECGIPIFTSSPGDSSIGPSPSLPRSSGPRWATSDGRGSMST